MRNTLLMALCLLTSSLAHAQLRPPVQTDTLVIKLVKYNYMDIKPENWPCDVIYKSTTDFRIGDQVFRISSARGGYSVNYDKKGVVFTIEDDSELFFYESRDERVVIYSDYEFFCDGAKRWEETAPDSSLTSMDMNVHLQGRSFVGSLPRPVYMVRDSGIVVVRIWVDQYGNVIKAQAGVEGTTTKNKTLWSEARKAAMGAHFNQKADAPALQEGTITYIFSLK